MPGIHLSGGDLKQGGHIPLAVGKAIGELKAIVCLDAFHPDASAGIPLENLLQEVSGGVGGLLRIGSQETQAGKLINGSVLKQAQLRVCNTHTGYCLHAHLDSLAGIGHLLIKHWLVSLFLSAWRKRPSLRMTRNKLYGQRVYPRYRSRCHSSTMPRLELRRRISLISLSSFCMCWLG